MKKITLLIVLLGFVTGTKAQSFSMDKDTSKKYWIFPGYDLDPHIVFTNTSSSGITFNWRMINFYKDDNWLFDGACDNKECYGTEVKGLMDGSKAFSTSSVPPGATMDFKMTFNGNAAANLTKALGTIEIWTGSEPAKKATFVAYKGTTGISTAILKDNEISIFPNPASGHIDIAFSPSSDVKAITVYNLIGKPVNIYKVTDQSSVRCVFQTDMPAGIYILRIADSKGNVIATKKITHQ